MTYDQVQSPRLGQRVPNESTYVQIFDVDTATPTADLVEAAWPGQLIFRQDRSILQIYDGDAEAWQDVAGGVAGQLTYVGPDAPTGTDFTVGDTWYDSDANYQGYVWDGYAWLAQATGGIKTFHAPGWVGDPPARVGPTASAIGDIWYQTDDFNHMFRWNGTVWVDVQDGWIELNKDTSTQNGAAITNLGVRVDELGMLAYSANNTADTADGRVSMSDYQPGKDDLYYESYNIDTLTGEKIYYLTQRVNGSIWYTRTRPRKNYCTNPSFETDDRFWTVYNATKTRVNPAYVPSGDWALQVTNDATVDQHYVAWGESAEGGAPVEAESQVFTASAFVQLTSGKGLGVTLNIRWYDSASALISTSTSAPMDLVVDSWNPALSGMIAEPRLSVTASVPVGATSLSVRIVSPNGNEGDVWCAGALLLEAQDDLGRYFDGDSYDGVWDGAADDSTSHLIGDKIQQLYELRDGAWVAKRLTNNTINDLDAGKLYGTTSGVIIGEATMPSSSMAATKVTASTNLNAGDLVGVWSAAGAHRVRPACAALTNRQEAHGYVLHNVTAGFLATVYHNGYNTLLSGLNPGSQWLSTTPGKTSNRPPTDPGLLVQRVGHAPSPTVLNFNAAPPILIT